MEKLRRPLQALLVAGVKQMEEVVYGKKKITIREGHRDYVEGPVLIGCHIFNWCVMRNITEVRHTEIKNVFDEECRDNGYNSCTHCKARQTMLNDLRSYYPDLDWNSPVTVIRFE